MTRPILIALDHITPATTLRQDGEGGAVPAQVEVGELIAVVVVMAANVVRDIRENLRNLIGGRMTHYERLIQSAVDVALADLQAKAQTKGYDGVVGVKISHPVVVEGGVEVIVYGNGFRLRPLPDAGGQSDEGPNDESQSSESQSSESQSSESRNDESQSDEDERTREEHTT